MADPTSEFPAGWTHDGGLGAANAGASFNESLTGLTAGTQYYFVAWSQVGGVWYPGAVLSFTTASTPVPPASCPANTVKTFLETVPVDSSISAAIQSSHTLVSGQQYLLVSSGTWQNSNTNVADTAYASVDGWATHMQGYDIDPYHLGANEFQLEVDGAFVPWGSYDGTNHTYSYLYTGTGATVGLGVFDGDSTATTVGNPDWYGDNSGSLSVDIYSCAPSTSSFTITKTSIGGDNTFHFTSTIPGHSAFDIKTVGGTGSVTFTDVASGTYSVTEVSQPKGWTQTDNTCSSVTIPDDGSVCNIVDTNNKSLGSIRGTKYEDWDGDGKPFETKWEDPLKGFTIYLDTNNNNQLDSGEPTSVTDKNGLYSFVNLPAGTYHVREVQKDGWISTYPSSNPANDEYAVNLSAGQNVKKKDFGNFKLGTISGMKFNDKDGDGRKDSGEGGLSGIIITLKGPKGLTLTTTTAADGSYSFTGLKAGTYTLSETVPSGWRQTVHPQKVEIDSGTVSKNNNFGDTQKPLPGKGGKKGFPSW
jgi:uncharacterized protein (DUF2141 family)